MTWLFHTLHWKVITAASPSFRLRRQKPCHHLIFFLSCADWKLVLTSDSDVDFRLMNVCKYANYQKISYVLLLILNQLTSVILYSTGFKGKLADGSSTVFFFNSVTLKSALGTDSGLVQNFRFHTGGFLHNHEFNSFTVDTVTEKLYRNLDRDLDWSVHFSQMKKSEVWVEKKISAWWRNLEGLITQVCRSHSGAKVLFSSHTNPCMMKSISFWMHSSSSGRNSSDEEMFSAMHEMLMIFSVKTLTSQSSANYRAPVLWTLGFINQ